MPEIFSKFALVIIPGGIPTPLTYGINESHIDAKIGDLVNIQVGTKFRIGVISKISDKKPNFKVKALQQHPSKYNFNEAYIKQIEWVAKYFLSTENQTLDVFLPSSFEKYLEKIDFEQKEFKQRKIEIPFELNEYQKKAYEQIKPKINSKKFSGFLLHGITGSGKSLIYLNAVKEARKNNQQVVILVPEINLSSQTHDNFQRYLNEEVLLNHSALSAPIRRRTWIKALRNEIGIVLGTRSTLLLPNLNPGLIIIDEEHDSSYKQHDPGPRYHARELALYLANKNKATIILGSATPSLESRLNAESGNLQYLCVDKRATDIPLPKIFIVDMKKQNLVQGKQILSAPLRDSIQKTIDDNKQVILLHNRRGYSSSQLCKKCGEVLECLDCKIPLIYHRKKNALLCHYCNRTYLTNTPCQHCGSQEYVLQGNAIEKVEEELSLMIANAKIIRLDRDSTTKKGSIDRILNSFRNQEFNILLGTQMVAKGHDFPNVQLVGVISADIGLNIPDFRGAERSFQMLTQVAGRAGRSQDGSKVFLQTWNPDNQVLKYAINHDYNNFFTWECNMRKSLFYPPYSKIIAIEINGRNEERVENIAQQMVDFLNAQNTKQQMRILGPSEAFISRVKTLFRQQIMIKSNEANFMRQSVNRAIVHCKQNKFSGITFKINYEPMDSV